MSKQVFANNMEVLSKSSSGKVTAAFPDVCFSPPAPPAGPIPLPYPNSAQDADLDKGSTKVFIGDKMVGMADNSSIQKSQGDEGATQGQSKGLITQCIQGKAYAILWSTDVQVEGAGVPRHLDMLTVNHASLAGNGGPMSHVAAANVTTQPNQQPVQEADGKLVAIDLKRAKSDKAYHTPHDRHTDTDAWQDEDAIQYVNLNGLSPQDIAYFKLNAEENHCVLGRRVNIRVRFSENKKFSFQFSIKKSYHTSQAALLYSDKEAEEGRLGDNAYYIINEKQKTKDSSFENTLTTDSSGMCNVTVDLDASGCDYIISATELDDTGTPISRKRSITIKAWRKLFYNTFMEQIIIDEGKALTQNNIDIEFKKTKEILNKQTSEVEYKIKSQKDLKLNLDTECNILQSKIDYKQIQIDNIIKKSNKPRGKNKEQFNILQQEKEEIKSSQNKITQDTSKLQSEIDKLESNIREIQQKMTAAEETYKTELNNLEDSVRKENYVPDYLKQALDSTTVEYEKHRIKLVPISSYYFNRDEYLNGNPMPDDPYTKNMDGIDPAQPRKDLKQIITVRTGHEEHKALVEIVFLGTFNPYIIRMQPASDPCNPPHALSLSNGSYTTTKHFPADTEIHTPLPMCGTHYALKKSRLFEGKLWLTAHNKAKEKICTFEFHLKDSHIIIEKKGHEFSICIPESEINSILNTKTSHAATIHITKMQYKFRLCSGSLGYSLGKRYNVYKTNAKNNKRELYRYNDLRFRGIILWGCAHKNDKPVLSKPVEMIIGVTHELAHNLGLVPGKYSILDKSPNWYDEHGHTGDHCNSGLSESEALRTDYTYTISSACVMWGDSLSEKTLFCDECKKALLKTNCDVTFRLNYDDE